MKQQNVPQHNAFTYCDQITQYQVISCSGNNWICNSSSQNIDTGHMRIPKLWCSLVLWAMPNGWECALTIMCHTILHCNPTARRYTSQVYWLNTVIWWQVNPLYPINFYFVVFSKYPSLYPKVGYSEMYRVNDDWIMYNWILDISEYPTNRIKFHGIQWKYLSSNHKIQPVYLADISPCCIPCIITI